MGAGKGRGRLSASGTRSVLGGSTDSPYRPLLNANTEQNIAFQPAWNGQNFSTGMLSYHGIREIL